MKIKLFVGKVLSRIRWDSSRRSFGASRRIATTLLGIALASSQLFAQVQSPVFIPADSESVLNGVDGFAVEQNEGESRVVHVLSSELFSTIERVSLSDCETIFVAWSARSGEQALLRVGADGVGEVIENGIVTGKVVPDGDGSLQLQDGGGNSGGLAARALLVAATDANLDLLRPCSASFRVVIPVDTGFLRDGQVWLVERATVERMTGGGTRLAFVARVGDESEFWQVAVTTGQQTAIHIKLNGSEVFAALRSDVEVSVGSAGAAVSASLANDHAPASVVALLEDFQSRMDFTQEVAAYVSTLIRADEPLSETEVMESCRQGCNADFPYGSNCQTITEKYGCCITDVQRAACRRLCFCHYYAGRPDASLWYAAYCGGSTGALFDIDVAACLFAFLRSWKL